MLEILYFDYVTGKLSCLFYASPFTSRPTSFLFLLDAAAVILDNNRENSYYLLTLLLSYCSRHKLGPSIYCPIPSKSDVSPTG